MHNSLKTLIQNKQREKAHIKLGMLENTALSCSPASNYQFPVDFYFVNIKTN